MSSLSSSESSLRVKSIAKNTSYLTLALIIQKIFSFTYFVILARNLGPDDLGKYYFAISFTTIFSVFIDLGLVNYLTRETAKENKKSSKLFNNIVGLKIITALLSFLALVFFINILGHHDTLTKQLVYISSISMILDSFTLTFFALARGFHNLKYESLSSIIFQFIVLFLGWIFLYFKLDLRVIILSLVIASLFNFIYSFSVLKFKLKISLKISWDWAFIKGVLLVSLPFTLYGIFQRIYAYLDSVLISYFSNDYYVGIYQVAFKIIFALQFLPMAFTASLYPAMSYYWVKNKEQLLITFRRSLDYLLLISTPIVMAILILADKIVLIFKNNYSEAIIPLQLSSLALIFIFLNFPIGSLLNACDRQAKNTRNMLIVLIFAVILNIALIPQFKAQGAALVVLLSNFLMFILGMLEVRKIISYSFKDNFINFLRIIFASLIMSFFIFFLKNYLNIFLLSFLAMLLYFAFLFLFGGFKKADLFYIINSFKKRGV